MKMIDVYNKMVKNQIQLGTKLIIDEKVFEYGQYCSSNGYCFIDEDNENVYSYYDIDSEFLNKEVELVERSEKKYELIMPGSNECISYIPYSKKISFIQKGMDLADAEDNIKYQFTKKEIDTWDILKPYRNFKWTEIPWYER